MTYIHVYNLSIDKQKRTSRFIKKSLRKIWWDKNVLYLKKIMIFLVRSSYVSTCTGTCLYFVIRIIEISIFIVYDESIDLLYWVEVWNWGTCTCAIYIVYREKYKFSEIVSTYWMKSWNLGKFRFCHLVLDHWWITTFWRILWNICFLLFCL